MKRSVLLRDDPGGGRAKGRGEVGRRVGCKPHKVILQNVYAKRFNGVAWRGEVRERGHSLHMILSATISTRHLRRQTYFVQLTSEASSTLDRG